MDVGWSSKSSREKEKQKKKRDWKEAEENFYFHFPHPLSRHINNGHFFNAPHMLHADVDAVSSYFSISHTPRTLFFSFLCFFFLSSSSSFEWLLKWDFLNREEKNMRGESFAVCWVVIYTLLCSLCIFYFIFFDVSFVKKIVISIFLSLVARFCVCYSAKKKIYWTKNVCCDIVSCTVGLMLWS